MQQKKHLLTGRTIRKKIIFIIAGLTLWQIYIYLISSNGFLANYDFPPKFMLFLVLPAFIFTGVFIYQKRNKPWITAIPEHWLVYFQSFRIMVESLFVMSLHEGILHKNMTIEGYNFDMIVGISALVIAFLVYQKKALSRKLIIWWNYIGLAVLASVILVVTTTIFFPELYGSKVRLMPTDFGTYPYVLIAGFLMPAAVFVHILSIVQLKKNDTLRQ